MPYQIRAFDTSSDFPCIVELVNTVNPEPVTEEAL